MKVGTSGGLTVWLTDEPGRGGHAVYSIEIWSADMRRLWACDVGTHEDDARIRARRIHSLLHVVGEHWSVEVQKLDLIQRGP